MHWIEYEKLALHRDHLTSVEQRRLEELDAEDERIGNDVAGYWFPEIIGGYLTILLVAGLVFFI